MANNGCPLCGPVLHAPLSTTLALHSPRLEVEGMRRVVRAWIRTPCRRCPTGQTSGGQGGPVVFLAPPFASPTRVSLDPVRNAMLMAAPSARCLPTSSENGQAARIRPRCIGCFNEDQSRRRQRSTPGRAISLRPPRALSRGAGPRRPFPARRQRPVRLAAPLRDRGQSPACRLLDLNSSNGTLVNGTLTKTCDLKDGDFIQAGETTFRLSLVLEPHETVEDTIVGLHPPRTPGSGSHHDTAEVESSVKLVLEEAQPVGWSPRLPAPRTDR